MTPGLWRCGKCETWHDSYQDASECCSEPLVDPDDDDPDAGSAPLLCDGGLSPEDRLEEAAKQLRLVSQDGQLNAPAHQRAVELEAGARGLKAMLEKDREQLEPEVEP